MKRRLQVLACIGVLATALPLPISAAGQRSELDEFRNRQTTGFSSAGHAKSGGLHITLRYPRSWRAAEAERPHVVQKFTASGGTNCNLLVRPLGEGAQADARSLLRPSNLRQLAPAGTSVIEATSITLDRLPAGQLFVAQAVSNAGIEAQARVVIFLTMYRDRLVNLTCTAGARTAAEADVNFRAFLPVFRQIANSLVFQDQYR